MTEGMRRVKPEGGVFPKCSQKFQIRVLGLLLGPLSRLVQTPRITAVRLALRNHPGHSVVLLEPQGPGQPVGERSEWPRVLFPIWEDREKSRKRFGSTPTQTGLCQGRKAARYHQTRAIPAAIPGRV